MKKRLCFALVAILCATFASVEIYKAQDRPQLAESRAAMEKAIAAGRWTDAAKFYIVIFRAEPNSPGLAEARAKIQPELAKTMAQSEKQRRASLFAAVSKKQGSWVPAPQIMNLTDCGPGSTVYCPAAFVASACVFVCAAADTCSDACKTCFTLQVDGLFWNCHDCVLGTCSDGRGGGGGGGGGGRSGGGRFSTLEGDCRPRSTDPRRANEREKLVCRTECSILRGEWRCRTLGCETKPCGIE